MKGAKTMYTVKDAMREIEEMKEEGYGFGAIRIFLHDLARSKDITWNDVTEIEVKLMNEMECGISTF